MRIGIIGAGGAGLAAAWLLEQEHDVTLFERADRLGGHAHTIEVDVDGRRVLVDAGFEFFGPGAPYVTFNRLLDALGVRRRTYPATMSLTRPGGTIALPPWRRGPVWRSLTPRAIADMLRFRRFLAGIPAFLAKHDTTVTAGEYIDALRLPASFTERFLYPLLLAFWCVEPEELRGFAAYNAFYYFAGAAASGARPPLQSQIDGGMSAYVSALAASLERADVRVGAGVERITRDGEGFVVHAGGRTTVVDQLVLATNARQAHALLEPLGFADVCRELERFEYFDTTIAVHGDRGVMPADRSAWSVVDIRWDGVHSQNTVWAAERGDVFRSWVTFDERMPEPLYAVATYEHGKITPDYFDAQARLRPLQGDGGLWLAGLYTDDADSHESAVRSAATIARRLSPGSARLAVLDGSVPVAGSPDTLDA